MRILLPAVSASRGPDGVSRHAANLAQCLLLSPAIDRVDLIAGAWQLDAMQSMLGSGDDRLKLSVARTGPSALARNWWYWNALPGLVRQLASDVVHATYPVPIHKPALPVPVVVTLHDLYPYDVPGNFGFPKVLGNRIVLQHSLRSADAIACVSQSTLNRLGMRAPDAVLRKAVAIYNCVVPGPAMAEECPLPGWSGEPFLLCVAQHRPNKNVILAIQVFQRLRQANDIPGSARLVIVGCEGPETRRIHRLIRTSGLTENVVLLSGIGDAELEWCYGHCELLLAPSTIEGFGLPVVEAMLRHCRVVCSDIPAFREVGGTYCKYAALTSDPQSAFVEAIRETLRSHRFRSAPTGAFAAVRVAQAHVQVYQRLCQAFAVRNTPSGHKQIPALERGHP